MVFVLKHKVKVNGYLLKHKAKVRGTLLKHKAKISSTFLKPYDKFNGPLLKHVCVFMFITQSVSYKLIVHYLDRVLVMYFPLLSATNNNVQCVPVLSWSMTRISSNQDMVRVFM